MNPYELLMITLVAVITGTFAQLTSGFSKGGWIVNIILGLLGSTAGTIVGRLDKAPPLFNIEINGTSFPIIYCLIGAVLFLAAIGIFIKPGSR